MSLPGPAGNQPDRPNTAAAPATTHRFVALDSLRGVCACIVVLYHLGGTIQLTELPLIRAGWLFVDFFFVLSGFVIAAAYRDRLARGFPVGRFMVLRLGRIYPLHVAVLLTMVAWESARLKLGGGWGHETFPADRVPSAVPVNLALLQIFGLYDRPTWNGPSWSIAAEVWTYLAAALCFQKTGRAAVPVVGAAVIASGVALALIGDAYLDRMASWSLLRCFYGFGLGVLGWRVFGRVSHRRWSLGLATVAECGLLLAITFFVPLANADRPLSMLCPLLFVAAVLVFALERGMVSRLLMQRPFVLVGSLSYSIYMIHILAVPRALTLAHLLGPVLGVRVASDLVVGALAGRWTLAALMLAIVIACAQATYLAIEQPCRAWSRRLAARWGVKSAEDTAPAL